MLIIRMEASKVVNVQLTFPDIVALLKCDKTLLNGLKNHAISPFYDTPWAYKISMISVREENPLLQNITQEKIVARWVGNDFVDEFQIVVYPVVLGCGLTIYKLSEEQIEALAECLNFKQGERNEAVEPTEKMDEIRAKEFALVP